MKNQILCANRSRKIKLNIFATLGFLLVLPGSTAAQYGDSYSRMLDMTRTWNQNLWDDQKRLNDITNRVAETRSSTGRSAVPPGYVPAPASPGPVARQYPITATDFPPPGAYMLPDQLADGIPGLSAQDREGSRKLFRSILTSFENGARKNNMANALAFITAISLQMVNGKQLTRPQENVLIAYFNNGLANTPQYNAFSPQQKQALYECLVITGGVIAFLQAKGAELHNPQMQAQSLGLSKAVLKHFLGIDAR
jgi:hypothetical protein